MEDKGRYARSLANTTTATRRARTDAAGGGAWASNRPPRGQEAPRAIVDARLAACSQVACSLLQGDAPGGWPAAARAGGVTAAVGHLPIATTTLWSPAKKRLLTSSALSSELKRLPTGNCSRRSPELCCGVELWGRNYKVFPSYYCLQLRGHCSATAVCRRRRRRRS